MHDMKKKNIGKFPSPFVSAILAIQFSKNKDGQLFKKNKISDLKRENLRCYKN